MTHRFADLTFTDSVKAVQEQYRSDYPNRRRLKILGHMRVERVTDVPAEIVKQVELPGYRALVERVVFIDVKAFDWNCPQHITRRYTELEIAGMLAEHKT